MISCNSRHSDLESFRLDADFRPRLDVFVDAFADVFLVDRLVVGDAGAFLRDEV